MNGAQRGSIVVASACTAAVAGNSAAIASGTAIIDALDLRRPIYADTAAFGHFGRELPQFTWERTDRAADLAAAAGL